MDPAAGRGAVVWDPTNLTRNRFILEPMRYEYRVIELAGSCREREDDLDEAGRGGWELVSVTAVDLLGVSAYAYFKRPLLDPE
jgi:hypothetical protein